MRIYLDSNATAPLLPRVRAALLEALSVGGNPSSVHQDGAAARRILDSARRTVAAAFGVLPGQVLFTAGGTEANNTVLAAYARRPIVVSAAEHESVVRYPGVTHTLPVTTAGIVCLDTLERCLQAVEGQKALVSVMLANNETGIAASLAAMVTLAHRYGADVHTDAAQAAGRLPIDFMNLGVDWLTAGIHKAGGPLGAGILLGRGLDALPPLLHGGAQEFRRRAGTENIPAIAGLAAVFDGDYAAPWQAQAVLRDAFEAGLPKEAGIVGQDSPRLPNTSCVLMPGVAAETQVMAFDLAGVSVSAGAACSSGKVAASRVLQAMGYDKQAARCAVRFSSGPHTTAEEWRKAGDVWRAVYQRAR